MKNYLLAGALAVTLAASASVVQVVNNGNSRSLKPGATAAAAGLRTGVVLPSADLVKKSAPSRAQEAVNLPWSVDFSQTTLDDFTIIDANDDDYTWSYDDYNGEVVANYSPKDNMDDWLITPPLNLTGGRAYTLKFMAASNSQAYTERLEVCYGDAPEVAAMSSTAMSATELTDIELAEFSCVIVPRTSGKVYIGFHGISDPNQYRLRISSMSLTEGAVGETPSGVKDLTVFSTNPYSLDATVSFFAPETTLSGKPLDSLDKITLKRDGVLIKTFENPVPGAELTYQDAVTNGGLYTYSVCASNAHGDGYEMTCSHTIGGVAPTCPENVLLKEIEPAGTMKLTWDPVTIDIDGNTIPEGFVRYIVLDTSMEVIAQDLTDTELTFSLAQNQQIFVQTIVAAYTIGGMSEGLMSNMVAVGPAFTDFAESFPDGEIETLMGVGYEFGYVDYVGWGLADDTTFSAEDGSQTVTSSDGDNGFAFMQCEYRDTGSSMFTGKITLPEEGPAVYFDIFNQSLPNIPDANRLELMVSEDGFEWETVEATTVYDLCGDRQGWHQVVIGLHDYAGKTVQLRWQVTVQSFATFLIDAIRVGTLPDYDLKAETFAIPSKVAPGQEVNFDLTVHNLGAKDADSFAVCLMVNDKEAVEIPCGKLEAGKRVKVTIPYTVSPVCESNLNVSAEILFDKDADQSDNTTAVYTITPEMPRYPYVSDLDGSVDEAGHVTLIWSEPYLQTFTPGELEDFEDGNDYTYEFKDWIFIDRDLQPLGGLFPSTIPGVEVGVTTASFMVINDEEPSFTEDFKAYSGHKFIGSIFSYNPGETVDDWAITPALNGAAQVVSFRARSLSAYYPETMEIYYSLGSTNPDDFILITTVDRVPGEWTEYNIPIPTGAKRFAVRNHSYDAMVLMLDDFFFADASAPIGIELEKYNIYCDEKPVGSVAGDVTTFSHKGEAGEHTYAVTAVYKELGESQSSNKKVLLNMSSGVDGVAAAGGVSVAVTADAIRVAGLSSECYSVLTPAGVCVAHGTANGDVTIPVGKGVYIVVAGDVASKVIVK